MESPATSASFPLHPRLLGPAHCLSALFLRSTFCTENMLCINKGVKIKQSGIYVISYKCLATTTLVTPTRTTKEEIINTQESSDSSHGAPFKRTAVRLPPFWPDRPALWFAQAEAQFELAALTSERTKLNYLISHLDHRHSAEVENVVTSPKAKYTYKMLKTELVRLSKSREQRVRHLLFHKQMGHRKPFQFLRHLKSLAPDVRHDFLRSIWTNRRPPHIQVIFAGHSEGNLDSALQLAHRICEVAPQPTMASVSTTSENSLLQRLEEFSRQVAAITIDRTRRRSHSRYRYKTGNLPSRGGDSKEAAYCWYRPKFRDKAQKCKPSIFFRPCSRARLRSQGRKIGHFIVVSTSSGS